MVFEGVCRPDSQLSCLDYIMCFFIFLMCVCCFDVDFLYLLSKYQLQLCFFMNHIYIVGCRFYCVCSCLCVALYFLCVALYVLCVALFVLCVALYVAQLMFLGCTACFMYCIIC